MEKQIRAIEVNYRLDWLDRVEISKIKADIEIDKMVCELEGYNFTEYLDSLQAVVSSYYNA